VREKTVDMKMDILENQLSPITTELMARYSPNFYHRYIYGGYMTYYPGFSFDLLFKVRGQSSKQIMKWACSVTI
jgi:hypothetical protein